PKRPHRCRVREGSTLSSSDVKEGQATHVSAVPHPRRHLLPLAHQPCLALPAQPLHCLADGVLPVSTFPLNGIWHPLLPRATLSGGVLPTNMYNVELRTPLPAERTSCGGEHHCTLLDLIQIYPLDDGMRSFTSRSVNDGGNASVCQERRVHPKRHSD